MKTILLALLLIVPALADAETLWSINPGSSRTEYNGPHGASVPVNCSVGDWYQSTSPSSNFNICGPANTWNTIGAGTITGSGSAGQVSFWVGASSLSGQAGFTWATASQTVTVGDASTASGAAAFKGSSSGTVTVKATASAGNGTFFLPASVSTTGQVLCVAGVGNGANYLDFCSPGGGGGGITSLNGLVVATQTVTNGDTNINWSSSGSTHTFTWTGTLGASRGGTNLDTSASTGVATLTGGTWVIQSTLTASRGGTNADSSAWSALPLVTAGTWSQFGGSTCSAGAFASAISASGVLTCSTPAGAGDVVASGTLTNNAIIIGNGSTSIRATAVLTNGQMLIGLTGGAPIAATIQTSSLTTSSGAGSFSINLPSITTGQVVIGSSGGPYTGFASTGLILAQGAGAAIVYPGANCASGQFVSGVSSTGGLTCASPSTSNVVGNGNAFTNHRMIVGRGGNVIDRTTGPALTDGQLYIGVTGADPTGAFLTAGSGISITPGSGTITIAATPGNSCVGGGNLTISNTASTGSVTFGSPLGDANYAVALTTTPGTGSPAASLVRLLSRSTTGFSVELSAAPGTGNSTIVPWVVVPSSCTF